MMLYCQHVWPVVEGRASVKLTPALIAEIVGEEVTAGATQVGALGKFPAKLIGKRKILLAAVTALVLTV